TTQPQRERGHTVAVLRTLDAHRAGQLVSHIHTAQQHLQRPGKAGTRADNNRAILRPASMREAIEWEAVQRVAVQHVKPPGRSAASLRRRRSPRWVDVTDQL